MQEGTDLLRMLRIEAAGRREEQDVDEMEEEESYG